MSADTPSLVIGKELGKGAHSTVYAVASLDFSVFEDGRPSYVAAAGDTSQLVAKLTECVDEAAAMKVFTKSADIRDIPRHPGVGTYEVVLLGVPAERCVSAVMRRYAGDMSQYVARRRGKKVDDGIAIATVLSLGEQLAAALAHLHAHGVWHLDVSFGNILVSDMHADAPQCAIVDLENSVIDATADTPSADFTADFAAPERETDAGPKSDVFSLAVVLYAFATAAEYPGLVEGVPGLGAGFLSRPEMTPARVAAVLHRDMPSHPQLAALLVTALSHDAASRISMDYFCTALRRLRAGGVLSFPDVLPPLRVRLASDEATRKLVIVNQDAGVYDTNGPCCVCGNIRHVELKHRTDCGPGDEGSIHLPGNTCPGSQRGPQALLGADTAEVHQGLKFHFLYPVVPEHAQPAAAAAAAAATAGGTSTPAPSASAAAPESDDDDAFVAVVDTEPLLNALQLHGGFAIAGAPVDGQRYTNPQALMVLDARTDAEAARSSPSVKLAFTAPQPWPSECTAQLQRNGRFHSPIPALLGATAAGDDGANAAHSFAWVMPGEEFTLRNGEQWAPAPEGGFVFLFAGAGSAADLDRFFAVAATVAPVVDGIGGGGSGARNAVKATGSSLARTALGFGAFVHDIYAGVDRAIRPPRPAGVAAAAAAQTPPQPQSEPQPQPVPLSAPTSSARPLPVAVHVMSVRHRIGLNGDAGTWRCGATGETGDLGTAIAVNEQLAASLKMPRCVTHIRLMQRTGWRGAAAGAGDPPALDAASGLPPVSNLFAHNGLAGFDERTRELVGVLALRVHVIVPSGQVPPGTALPSAAGADGWQKLSLLIPAEGDRTSSYRATDAPSPLQHPPPPPPSPTPSDGSGIAPLVRQIAMLAVAPVKPPNAPGALSLDWFFATEGDMTVWHVRRMRIEA